MMKVRGFHYNFDQYRFGAAHNNAHALPDQITYFELIPKVGQVDDYSGSLDRLHDYCQDISTDIYISDSSWALEPVVVVPRKFEHKILEICHRANKMGFRVRFPENEQDIKGVACRPL